MLTHTHKKHDNFVVYNFVLVVLSMSKLGDRCGGQGLLFAHDMLNKMNTQLSNHCWTTW